MNNTPLTISQDLAVILNQLKSKNEIYKELSLNQLISYLNNNREFVDEIIEELSKFLDNEKQSLDDTFFYKIIKCFCLKLEENNLSTTKFINKIFPLLMSKIYYYKENKQNEDILLFDIISDFTKKCENNIGQIEFNLKTVFEKLKDEKNPPEDATKYALITVLKEFLHNAPLVSFSKIMKFTNGFKKIISDFKHKDESIRKAVQFLIKEFLLILLNKDSSVRKKQSENIIYETCIKEYIDKKNNTEYINHGIVLVMEAFTIKKKDKINEFFKEKFKIFLDFLYNGLTTEKNLVKLAIIGAIPHYCEYLPIILEENEYMEYFKKILKSLTNMYSEKKIDEKIKLEIIKAFGKLSLIESLKNPFSEQILIIIGMIRNDIIERKIFNENILDSFADFMTYYNQEFIAILTFDIYYEKMFSCGLKEQHINFFKKLINQYEKDSKESIQIIICLLNAISCIISDKEFNFKNSQKKIKIIQNNENQLVLKSEESNPNKDNNINLNENDKKYFNNVGKIIFSYIKEKKEKGIDYRNEIKNALILLGLINNEMFEKDIMNFYVEECINNLNSNDKEIKKQIIQLADSPWIPKKDNKQKLLSRIEYHFNYILEYFINLLLNEPDVEIKMLILNTINDERYYEFLSMTKYFTNFVLVIEYDNNLLKEKAIEIISKIISLNFNLIYTYIREKILKIYSCLTTCINQYLKEENIILLSYFVKYIGNYIIGEIEKIFPILLKVLREEANYKNNNICDSKKQNDMIILAILSVISELIKNKYYNQSQMELYINDIMLISINILGESVSSSSIKEETALYTILCILSSSDKDLENYSDYVNLFPLIIQILSKSQNKKSRLYAMKIFGYIGTINPNKLNKKANFLEDKNENDSNVNQSKLEDGTKINKSNVFQSQNKNETRQNKLNKNILIKQYKKFDFQKAVQDKLLDSNTYYSINVLMKILLNNNNYEVSTRIISLLKDILGKLGENDYPIIYLILPTILFSIKNFDGNTKILILEVISLIIKTYREQSLPYIEEILLLTESYILEESKSKNNEKIDICLDIMDKLCENYSNEISSSYSRIIPMILGLLSDKEDISINTKRKVISCLSHIGKSLSDYFYLIIPELTNCLTSLINKIKFYSNNIQNPTNTKTSLLHLRTSSLLNSSNNKNNINLSNYMTNYNESLSVRFSVAESNFRKTIEPKINSYDNSQEKKLEQDIFNLMNNLLNMPGILKYLEKIIKFLCFYMEASQSSQNIIMNMFVKILDNFQREFMIFYPYILNFSKKIGIPNLNYFKEFRFGLEKNEIMSLFAKEKLNKKTVLPHIGNILVNDNNSSLNKSSDSNDGNNSFNNSPNNNNLNKSVNNSTFPRQSKISGYSRFNNKSIVISQNIHNEHFNLNREINKGTIEALVKEFDTSNCLSEEDWHEWFKNSTKKLFEQSPSYIIFSCHKNNVYDPQVINELYNSAFYSLWKKCGKRKRELAKNLQIILKNPKTPNEILLTVLNIIEFINKEENEPFDLVEFETLGNIADICRAYAKALYYIEKGYINNIYSDDLIKLINLYIDLELPESAMGIYRLSQTQSKMDSILNEKNLNLKLHQWEKVLQNIEEEQKEDCKKENDKNLLIKKALCLEGLSDWENLLELEDDLSKINSESIKNQKIQNEEDMNLNIPLVLSKAALNLGEWDKLKKYSSHIKSKEDNEFYEENFFKAIVSIKEKEYEKAQKYINAARDLIDDKIKVLLNESYERAYKLLLDNENLCELEDIIKLNKNNSNINEFIDKKEKLKIKWDKLMNIKEEEIKTYERIIGIRKIIFNPEEDFLSSLNLSKICRKKDKFSTCMLVLKRLKKNFVKSGPNITVQVDLAIGKCYHDNYEEPNNLDKAIMEIEKIVNHQSINEILDPLKSKIYCYYGMWRAEKIDNKFNEKDVNNILKDLELSTKYNHNNYKSWHSYALLNYKFFEFESQTKINYSINAIEGFSKSICLGGKNSSKILQDLLLLLNIWFQVGMEETINKLMNEKIDIIPLDSWCLVIPQLLARINVINPLIRNTLITLLKKIGLQNPRSLTYSLSVLQNSKSKIRAEAVSLILKDIKQEHDQIFKECELIINELNRCALCLHEQWSETIEESAKLFFQSNDIKNSTKILTELHKKMENHPITMNEVHFHQTYKSELNEAKRLLQDYLENNNLVSFKEAWDIYHSCFRSISNNFSSFECLDLESISPKLLKFRESEIEIPGTYQNIGNDEGSPIIKISSFSRKLTVLNSKQHPRRIVIYGSDGKEYPFLLKGHEDIRQDERVMQLFGLINTLLSKDSDTREKNLSIKRYPVIPLSHNTGIIGWVSNSDTLHQLIKENRQINKIPINIEHRLMSKFNPKFDSSSSMTKLEVFKYSLYNTLGNDLYKILWNKSQNAEDWLERRTNYSRSLAVMSIVGYILGLGDRHPSNIMVDRISGKILHIDFGDCFEVAMKRDKFPEKVPFRLTRMLIKALEIGGIEGVFRITCENVMRVIRESKDSLNVILGAFVHDPLISFRLLIPLIVKQSKNKNKSNNKINEKQKVENLDKNEHKVMEEIIKDSKTEENELEKKRVGSDERQLYNELEEKDDTESDDLNQIAKIVLERVSDKLNGTDFNKNEELKIYEQIQRLIKQATSHENLSQSYLGWCPFW